MTDTQWVMLIAIIIYACLAAVAFKFPRTKDNWTKERKESIQLVMSVSVFVTFFIALWYISYVIEWPETMTLIWWGAALTFFGLMLIGIFAPQGIKLNFEKKNEVKVSEEED